MTGELLKYHCLTCDHSKSVWQSLTRAGLLAPKESVTKPLAFARLDRMKCSVCGGKEIEVIGKKRQTRRDFLASDNSEKRIFHRSSCYFADKTRPGDEFYFADPKDAEKQGYVPCRSCKPGRT